MLKLSLAAGKVIASLKNNKGDIGIKQIAATLGAIVVIGLVVTLVQGKVPTWIDQIWNYAWKTVTGNAP